MFKTIKPDVYTSVTHPHLGTKYSQPFTEYPFSKIHTPKGMRFKVIPEEVIRAAKITACSTKGIIEVSPSDYHEFTEGRWTVHVSDIKSWDNWEEWDEGQTTVGTWRSYNVDDKGNPVGEAFGYINVYNDDLE